LVPPAKKAINTKKIKLGVIIN